MGYTVSYVASGRHAAEGSVLLLPRVPDPNKRMIMIVHGANATAYSSLDTPNWRGFGRAAHHAANMGFMVFAADFGGMQTWGNDVALAAAEDAWDWAKGTGWCATDKAIWVPGSMGQLTVCRFAVAHPDEVAGISSFIPCFSPDDIRNTNALGARDSINTAWGIPAGQYPSAGHDPLPERGRPLAAANLAATDGIPTQLWYSTADTVTKPQYVEEYAAGRSGVELFVTSTTADHSGAQAVEGTDFTKMQQFFDALAYA